MSDGSDQSEGPNDQQCRHCGLWFHSAGLLPHETNCDFAGSPHRLHDLTDPYAIRRADDVDIEATVDGDSDPTEGESGAITADPGLEPAPDPAGEPAPEATATVTDGGEPEPVPDDWEAAEPEATDEPVDADPVDEPADRDSCPTCGSTVSIPVDELPDKVLEAVPDLAEFDELCRPCSVTDDGTLAQEVEAY